VKIKQMAAGTLIPAAVAGLALSAGATAQAASTHPAAIGKASETVAVRADFSVVQHGASAAAKDATAVAAKAVAEVAAKAAAAQAAAAQAAAAQAAARQTAAQAQQTTASQQSLTSGMSAFEQCVAWRESSNNPTDPDGLFGILPSTWASLGYSGTAGQASVALQKVAFNRLYAEYGTQPWAPSDGC